MGEGSSPLARGLHAVDRCGAADRRIIPARAGSTLVSASSAASAADHPRSRGVYRAGRRPRLPPQGSSPLARGLRNSSRLFSRLARIIPARAGFTTARSTPTPWARDHPRSRGVYVLVPGSVGVVQGSSPLARGLPGHDIERRRLSRIIPARAGFTIT